VANKPYDRQLGEMARVLSKQVSVQAGTGTPVARFVLPAGASEILHTDEADDIYYQVLGLRGEYLSGDRQLPVPACTLTCFDSTRAISPSWRS
jgi:two-component system sensor histidine kinase TctE